MYVFYVEVPVMDTQEQPMGVEDLPSMVKKIFNQFVVTELPDSMCHGWVGASLAPRKPGGHRLPTITFNDTVYSAALVAWPVFYNKPYPHSYVTYHCGNYLCVNPEHITPKIVARKPMGRPKRIATLSDTVHYEQRKVLIADLLRVDPLTTRAELLSVLREKKLGGKTQTVMAIIDEVRKELGLRNRIPSRWREKEQAS